MVAFALQLDEHTNRSSNIAGLFGKSNGGEHGHTAFTNFETKHGHGGFSSIAHKDDERKGIKPESVLLRNLKESFFFGTNNPWNPQQNGIFSQFINKAFDVLGVSSTQQKEAINSISSVMKEKGFNAPVVSDNATPEEVQHAVVIANPTLFAHDFTTGAPLELKDLEKSCEISIPADVSSLCGGQGLPLESATIMFAVHMKLDIEPKQSMASNHDARQFLIN